MGQLKLVFDGKNQESLSVIDEETGAKITGVLDFRYEINCEDSGKLHLTIYDPAVDFTLNDPTNKTVQFTSIGCASHDFIKPRVHERLVDEDGTDIPDIHSLEVWYEPTRKSVRMRMKKQSTFNNKNGFRDYF